MQLGQAALARAGDRGGGRSLTDSFPRAPRIPSPQVLRQPHPSLTPGPAPLRLLLPMPPMQDEGVGPALS